MAVKKLQGRALARAMAAVDRLPINRRGREVLKGMFAEAAASGEKDRKIHARGAAERIRSLENELIAYELERLKRDLEAWRELNGKE